MWAEGLAASADVSLTYQSCNPGGDMHPEGVPAVGGLVVGCFLVAAGAAPAAFREVPLASLTPARLDETGRNRNP